MTDSLWTAGEAATATGGEIRGDWQGVHGISIDTRELAAGDLYVALKGITHDGHVYVAQALEAGAAAALVSHVPDGLEDAPLLLVDDTLAALTALGRAGRDRSDARIVAVTGSVGKTSTKDMLCAMLGAEGRTHAATRSFNNHWGVPLTLARMPRDTEYAVIEIGMNHPGEIVPLSRLARPHVAMITTVEAVHMEAFTSEEEIADAKAEIFAGLEPGGVAVLNAGNRHFAQLAAAAPGDVLRFNADGAEAGLTEVKVCETTTCVRARLHGRDVAFKIGAPGKHFAENALGAILAAEAAGADATRAMLALGGWRPPAGRGSRVRILLGPDGMDGAFTLLDESYNANPASMRAALSVLAASAVTHDVGRVGKGRRLAYLGDMLELGPTEMDLHAALAALPEIAEIDRVHCCGPRMKALHDALPVEKRGLWCADSEELGEKLPKTVDAGDVCMVKGSLGARMARVVTAIKALGAEDPGASSEDA